MPILNQFDALNAQIAHRKYNICPMTFFSESESGFIAK